MPRLLFLFSFLLLLSCSGAGKTGPVHPTEKTDTCRLDAGNTYEVFIPSHPGNEKLPLLVIVDAHGAGKFALQKFKMAAGKYPMAVVASNLVKNGFAGYEQALQTFIDDARQKYPVGNTLFLAGFSGGARMALGYALGHKADGLILCGALAGRDQLTALTCPVFSISGTDDFNFSETAQYLFGEQAIPANLKIELIHSSHTWPDSLVLANAAGYLYFATGTAANTDLQPYVGRQQTRIDSLKIAGDLIGAELIARNMASTAAFDPDKSFAAASAALKADNNYIQQMTRLGNSLNTEMTERQKYVEAFSDKDLAWWKNEIDAMNGRLKTEQDPFRLDMYRRLKSFWGIVCYSFCKQSAAQHNAQSLEKVLAIYGNIEPENPDMHYFTALSFLWEGDKQAAIQSLKKALQLGFGDRGQLAKDFPEEIRKNL